MQTFEKAMHSLDFTVTVELPLLPTSTAQSLQRDLDALRGAVAAVQVTDSHDGVPHMAPLVAASLCLERGMDAVVQLSGRDRNRIALQSELLGAAAAGVTSLLLLRGDRLPDKLTPRASKVYEFGAKRLLRAASLIGSEASLPPQNGFFLGAPVKVIEPPPDWRPAGLRAKADVGCQFVQTQPLLDTGTLERYMQRLVASKIVQRVSVVVSVPLLDSVTRIDELRSRARPALIPNAVVERMLGSRDPVAEGVAICAETLAALRRVPGVAGANIVAGADAALAARAISLSEFSN